MLGALKKSTTKVVPGSFIAVSIMKPDFSSGPLIDVLCRMFLIESLASKEIENKDNLYNEC